jgi:hypothetical protein
MDVRFLKDISEAYIIDTEITNATKEQVFTEIYDMLKFVRETDPELYDELYEVERVRQAQILRRYMDLVFTEEEDIEVQEPPGPDEDILTEELLTSVGLTLALLALGSYFTRKPLSRMFFKSLSTIGGLFSDLGKWLSKNGKYAKIRYAIIQENFQKCYVKCDIRSPRDLSSLVYLSIKEGSHVATKLSATQAECLRNCYLDHIIELINLHMECYFACLKKTGNFSTVQNTDSDDIMRMITTTKVGAVCGQYHEMAVESLKDFYSTLDYVYSDPQYDDKKLEWIQKLRQKIYSTRQIIAKTNEQGLQRYAGENTPKIPPTFNYQKKQYHN